MIAFIIYSSFEHPHPFWKQLTVWLFEDSCDASVQTFLSKVVIQYNHNVLKRDVMQLVWPFEDICDETRLAVWRHLWWNQADFLKTVVMTPVWLFKDTLQVF